MSDPLYEVAELLFGGGGHDLIEKMSPDQSDVASKGKMSDRNKRRLTAGLSAVGATAGAAGLGYAAHKTGGAYKLARAGLKGSKAVKGKMAVKSVAPMSRRKAAVHAVKEEKLGAALVPLEVAGLGGEIMATRILHGDTKKGVHKSLELTNNASVPTTKGELTRAVITNPRVQRKGVEYTSKAKGKLMPTGARGTAKVEKSVTYHDVYSETDYKSKHGGSLRRKKAAKELKNMGAYKHNSQLAEMPTRSNPYPQPKPISKQDQVDITWTGEIAKANEDKQQIFGWASVVEVNGEPVVDLQGDAITADEMEKAGYEYVMKSRKGGDMHLRDNWSPIQKSEMIESFIVTDDKREAMGLPSDIPTGWWVGFQVRDPEVWAKVKSGERTGFSIHGHGRRTPAGA